MACAYLFHNGHYACRKMVCLPFLLVKNVFQLSFVSVSQWPSGLLHLNPFSSGDMDSSCLYELTREICFPQNISYQMFVQTNNHLHNSAWLIISVQKSSLWYKATRYSPDSSWSTTESHRKDDGIKKITERHFLIKIYFTSMKFY